MKIVIDARMLTWTGIGRYTSHLLEELQRLDQKNHYFVLLGPKDFETWEPTATNFQRVRTTAHPYGLAGQLQLRRQLRRLQPDLVHFTHFTVPLGYRGKYVVTIYDFTLLDYRNIRGSGPLPWLKYELRYRIMKPILNGAIKHAARVVTMTSYIAEDIHRRYGVPLARIDITPGGALDGSASKPIRPPGIEGSFLLYVGNAYPFKNLDRLIDAFRSLNQADYSLVLVGKLEYFYEQLGKRIRQTGIDNIMFTGFVTDNELAWLYRNATAYVFPSLSEGFGLPGLEAMAHGLPVVSSNAACLPEVYGEAAYYFDPLNTQDIAAKITEMLDDAKLREKLKRAGLTRVKDFSWERMAQQTLEIYRQATI